MFTTIARQAMTLLLFGTKAIATQSAFTLFATQSDASLHAAIAKEILYGGENYDGADGARIVAELCDDVEFFLALLNKMKVA